MHQSILNLKPPDRLKTFAGVIAAIFIFPVLLKGEVVQPPDADEEFADIDLEAIKIEEPAIGEARTRYLKHHGVKPLTPLEFGLSAGSTNDTTETFESLGLRSSGGTLGAFSRYHFPTGSYGILRLAQEHRQEAVRSVNVTYTRNEIAAGFGQTLWSVEKRKFLWSGGLELGPSVNHYSLKVADAFTGYEEQGKGRGAYLDAVGTWGIQGQAFVGLRGGMRVYELDFSEVTDQKYFIRSQDWALEVSFVL